MSTITHSKSAADLLFSHYLRTGVHLTGEAAEAFLESKSREVECAGEQKSAKSLLFAHYLRTGERLYGEAAERFLELKFNQRHYRENGQFARAGEGALYGSGGARTESAARARHSNAPAATSRTAFPRGTASNTNPDIVVIGDKDKQFRDDFNATFGASPSANRGAPPTAKNPSSAPQRPSTSRELGSLSAHYETGGRGVATVSTGMGRNGVPDRGGVSYGSYQLTSQSHRKERDGTITIIHDGGNVANFLHTEGSPWAREFGGHVPGSRSFSEVWRRIAGRDGATLHAAEHGWVKRTSYDPAVAMIRNATGLDIDHENPSLRDALWSTAVQHGKGSIAKKNGAAKIFVDAVATTDASTSRNAPDYPERLIRNMYARRTAYWPSDRSRYQSEMQNALARLRSE